MFKALRSRKHSEDILQNPRFEQAFGIYIQPKALSQWVHTSPKFKIRPNAKSIARSGGQYRSRLRGRGMDFSEVRLYQAGDDIRSFDWRVTARTSKPHTKLYEEEKERPVIIVVDQGPSLFFGSQHVFKSFFAARLAALIAFQTVRQGDRLGALIFNHASIRDLPAKRGEQSWQLFCRHLCDFNHQLSPTAIAEQALDWKQVTSHLTRIVRPGSLVILISDFAHHFSDGEQAITKIRAHNDLIAIHVSDPMEHLLPAQTARYTNGEETLFVDGQNQRTQRAFQQTLSGRLQKLTSLCKKQAVPLIQVSTADDPYDIAKYLDSRPGK